MSQNKAQGRIKISFFGGTQEVTGANYLIEIESAGRISKLIIDCGLFQGSHFSEEQNKEPFLYDLASVDALLVTHAHMDHIGRIPKLVKDGFRGKIFSTSPTRDLSQLMLADSFGLMMKNFEKGQEPEPVYNQKDIDKSMTLWETIDYGKEFEVADFKIKFKNAGHILGSAIVEISCLGKKIVFTGDLGNPPNPILPDAEEVTDADYLVIESTYGDREHESVGGARVKLERVIEDTIKSGGVLMIPAFSLERTQKLLFEINDLVEHGRVPRVPFFLDSPLAIKATDIYKKNQNYFNETAKDIIYSGDELFNFPCLKLTPNVEESKAINDVQAPKIIIAGSGMSNGGRIIHHERRYLSGAKNTLLLIGYQSAGSLGRRLLDGASEVAILGETVPVNAKIENISGYSSHPDMNNLLSFVTKTADTIKKVFVVQGEIKSSLFFVQTLRDNLGIDAAAPKFGDSFEINV